ncbi:calcium-binding protein [Cavenderia fasciculata]|uniref:Calcium-binding protein n=1 Tax=Cavenderia fasciculata TaxID=261658 RepID=F4QCD4_CACFS|nr:calcium-binding protein [Cavenderia fasciculata]EGG13569.1 calcium-binding protein [Cavenderia fasciculata]|eukprot:XP_004350273.1 calcium-binding protein [Cavenderia fasciculata]
MAHDKSEDSNLSFLEIAGMNENFKKEVDRRTEELLTLVDTNKNGYLTLNEVEEWMDRMKVEKPKEKAIQIFGLYDMDSDSVILKSEIEFFWKTRFTNTKCPSSKCLDGWERGHGGNTTVVVGGCLAVSTVVNR